MGTPERHSKLCSIGSMEGDVVESHFLSLLLMVLKKLTQFVHVTQLLISGKYISSYWNGNRTRILFSPPCIHSCNVVIAGL